MKISEKHVLRLTVNSEISRGFNFRETLHMRSFVKKILGNGEITLSFTDKVKSCPSRDFLASQICLLALFVKIKFSRKFPDLQYKEVRYYPQYREDREERSSQVRWCSLIHIVAVSREN